MIDQSNFDRRSYAGAQLVRTNLRESATGTDVLHYQGWLNCVGLDIIEIGIAGNIVGGDMKASCRLFIDSQTPFQNLKGYDVNAGEEPEVGTTSGDSAAAVYYDRPNVWRIPAEYRNDDEKFYLSLALRAEPANSPSSAEFQMWAWVRPIMENDAVQPNYAGT